jgi:rhodanese-related sulfurtransferase
MDSWTWIGFYTTVTGAAEVERKAKGGAVPVDLRSAEEFDAGHLPGAIHALAEDVLADPASFERRLKESVPAARAVTLYLDGGAEPLLYRVAGALEGQGRLAVFIYPAGFSAWEAEERPVHSTE